MRDKMEFKKITLEVEIEKEIMRGGMKYRRRNKKC
jgi:hypothetical protein